MASPSQEINLTTSIQFAAYDHTESTADCIAMATVRAPLYEPQSRSAVDIVAVIDRSGSMSGIKLDLVRKTLLFVIDQLKACDRICLVLYDDRVDVEFPLTLMTKENKELTKAKVEKIRDRGATNLCGGLLKGMEQIIHRSSDQKAKVASVLLFTDGLANRGIKNMKDIIDAMRDPISSLAKPGVLDNATGMARPLIPRPPHQMLQQLQQPVPAPPSIQQMVQTITQPPEPMDDLPAGTVDFEGTVYTFGFGSDHNGDLLTAISNAANGVYYFIDSTEKIAECFADCLGGLLSVVGQNMTLTIEAQPNCTLGTVHYKNKPQMEPDNKKCVVSLGDLQSEEERDIVIPINLEAIQAKCAAQPLIKVTLSYFNVITTLMQTSVVDLAVDRKSAVGLRPNEAVTVQLQRVQVALALEEARKIAPLDLQRAKAILQGCKKLLLESGVVKHQLCQVLLTDLNKAIDDMRDRHAYEVRGSHTIASFGQEHMAQRSNFSPSYITAAKSAMRTQTYNLK